MPRINTARHQYIDRATGAVADERLMANRIIRTLYSPRLENAPLLAKLASSRKMSEVLGYLNYDNALSSRLSGMRRFLRSCGIDAHELVDDPKTLQTPRQVFERKIRYWQYRPLPRAEQCVVCPSDSRMMLGSLSDTSGLFLWVSVPQTSKVSILTVPRLSAAADSVVTRVTVLGFVE